MSGGNQVSDSVAEKTEDEGNISDESANEDDGDDESTIAELYASHQGLICVFSYQFLSLKLLP